MGNYSGLNDVCLLNRLYNNGFYKRLEIILVSHAISQSCLDHIAKLHKLEKLTMTLKGHYVLPKIEKDIRRLPKLKEIHPNLDEFAWDMSTLNEERKNWPEHAKSSFIYQNISIWQQKWHRKTCTSITI